MKLRPLVATVARALRGFGCPAPGGTIVVGLSGGADSTALLDALAWLGARQGFRVVAAHLDHRLRADSAEDAAACERLCRALQVEFRRGEADVKARAARERAGTEAAARSERYAFLREVMREEGAVAIAVGHTEDDQAETVLLRLLRGSGATGLGAMRARQDDVLRPLLHVSRREVLDHLASRGLGWREDPTNADPAFVRNRVRHELLPFLARFNPAIRETLARSATVLADEADFVGAAGRALLAMVMKTDGGRVLLDRLELAAAHPAVARAAIRLGLEEAGGRGACSALHVERLLDLARAARASGRRQPLPGDREAVVHFGQLSLGRRGRPSPPFAMNLTVPGRTLLPGGRVLTVRATRGPARSGAERAVVALGGKGAPLLLRSRRPGDRVFVRGRSISLKRFLMERRVPLDARAALPLVASGACVLFVPGLPVDSPPGRRFVRLEVQE